MAGAVSTCPQPSCCTASQLLHKDGGFSRCLSTVKSKETLLLLNSEVMDEVSSGAHLLLSTLT